MSGRDARVGPDARRVPGMTATRAEWQRRARAFLRNRVAAGGLVLGLVIAGLALAAPLLSSWDPLEQSARARLAPPDTSHLLGRDGFGRDVLSRLLYAGRVSLLVGLLAMALGGTLGSLLG